jgi:hypothetical protein
VRRLYFSAVQTPLDEMLAIVLDASGLVETFLDPRRGNPPRRRPRHPARIRGLARAFIAWRREQPHELAA